MKSLVLLLALAAIAKCESTTKIPGFTEPTAWFEREDEIEYPSLREVIDTSSRGRLVKFRLNGLSPRSKVYIICESLKLLVATFNGSGRRLVVSVSVSMKDSVNIVEDFKAKVKELENGKDRWFLENREMCGTLLEEIGRFIGELKICICIGNLKEKVEKLRASEHPKEDLPYKTLLLTDVETLIGKLREDGVKCINFIESLKAEVKKLNDEPFFKDQKSCNHTVAIIDKLISDLQKPNSFWISQKAIRLYCVVGAVVVIIITVVLIVSCIGSCRKSAAL